jgi:hypothetical protein
MGSFLFAQEQEEQGNVFTISTWKVPFTKLDEFQSLWEKEVTPSVKQNEFILSQRVFTHLWGPDWTVVTIIEYESLSAIESANKRSQELSKEKYPEKEKRDEIRKQIQSFFTGHTDAIVRENPKLRK